MKPKQSKEKGNLIRDLGIVLFSVIIGVLLAKTAAVESFLLTTSETRIFGSFVAGIFFTSIPVRVPSFNEAETITYWICFLSHLIFDSNYLQQLLRG